MFYAAKIEFQLHFRQVLDQYRPLKSSACLLYTVAEDMELHIQHIHLTLSQVVTSYVAVALANDVKVIQAAAYILYLLCRV